MHPFCTAPFHGCYLIKGKNNQSRMHLSLIEVWWELLLQT